MACLGATVGLGAVWWITESTRAATTTAVLLAGQIAIAFLVFQVALRFDLERVSAPNLAAPAMLIAGCVLQFFLGAHLTTTSGYALIGATGGLLYGVLRTVAGRRAAMDVALPLVGLIPLAWVAWHAPVFDLFALVQIGAVFFVPTLTLSALAPTRSLAAAGRALAVVQAAALVWLAPLVALGMAYGMTEIPLWTWPVALVVTVGLGILFRLPGWKKKEWLWWGAGSSVFFPFKMRPTQSPAMHFYLEEMLHEPAASVNASIATVWVYRQGKQIVRLMVTGHANLPVCREITAKMFTTLVELGDRVTASLFVPGAFEVSVNPASPSVSLVPPGDGPFPFKMLTQLFRMPGLLDDLYQQLCQVREMTGLVAVREMGEQGTDVLESEVLRHVEKFQRTGQARLLYCGGNGEPRHVAFLPFYTLNTDTPSPLSLDLPIGLFQGAEFDYLLKEHRRSLVIEMTRDARRRKQVYQEWLDKDRDDLSRLASHVLNQLVPGLAHEQMSSLVEALIEQTAQVMESIPATLTMESLEQFLIQHRQAAARVSVRALLQSHIPNLHFSDDEWKNQTAPLKEKQLPIQGTRNYLEATVTESETVHGYISLMELVEGHLPGLIRWDLEWIAKMDELLKKFREHDPVREARIEAISLAVLLDSFLRGWPPDFLEGERARESYKRWCDTCREPVWRAIHRKLWDAGQRIDPLLVDNVVFRVGCPDAETIRITPLYVTTDRELMLLLSRKIGLTYYINLWQHRQLIWAGDQPATHKSNSALSNRLCRAGVQSLVAGDMDTALAQFRQALRTHPVVGALEFFSHWWNLSTRDTSAEFKEMSGLVRAVRLFSEESERDVSIQLLTDFIHKWPEYLPDPYLLMSIAARERELGLAQIRAEFQEKLGKYNALRNELVRKGILVPEPSGRDSDNQTTVYRAYISPWDYTNRQKLEELQRIQEEINRRATNLKSASQELWASLRSKDDNYITHAMMLNPGYVTRALNEESLFPSEGYIRRVGPLHAAFKGDEHLQIARILAEKAGLVDRLKENLRELRQVIAECQKVSYLSTSEIGGLIELGHILDAVDQPDSIEREMVVRNQMDQVRQNHIYHAYRCYDDAMALPEFTEVRKRFALCLFLMARYHQALASLNQPELPVAAAFPQARFEIIDPLPHPIASVTFDHTSGTISVLDSQGRAVPVVRVTGLTKTEVAHLTGELAKPDFMARLATWPLIPAYAILSTPIASSPLVQAWQTVLTTLEPWLVRTMAYAGVTPAPDLAFPDQKAIEAFEKTPILERVKVDLDLIQKQVLDQFGLRRNRIIIERLE